MLSTQQTYKQRVYVRTKKDKLKKLGKPRAVVFHPNKAQVVGVIIKRPDLLLMFKRKDRFCAIDRLVPIEGGLEAVDQPDSWDKAACTRMDIDYDECLIWDGMSVQTEDGRDLGTINNVYFDEDTFAVDRIDLSEGAVSRTLLGEANITCDMIRGFGDGRIVVRAQVESPELEGGAAAAAGETWAKAKHSASEAAADAGKSAGEAMDKGAHAAGTAVGTARKKMNDAVDAHEARKAADEAAGVKTGVDKAANSLGRQLGKASHMFKDFKDEYNKASRD